MYLNQKDVEDIINIIDDKVFMEIMPLISVKNTKEKSVEKAMQNSYWC